MSYRMGKLHLRGIGIGFVLGSGLLEQMVQIRRDIHVFALVHLQIFEVADENGIHTGADNMGNQVKDNEGDADSETQRHSGQGSVLSFQDTNCNDSANGSKQGLADEKDETANGVHDDSREHVARN